MGLLILYSVEVLAGMMLCLAGMFSAVIFLFPGPDWLGGVPDPVWKRVRNVLFSLVIFIVGTATVVQGIIEIRDNCSISVQWKEPNDAV